MSEKTVASVLIVAAIAMVAIVIVTKFPGALKFRGEDNFLTSMINDSPVIRCR